MADERLSGSRRDSESGSSASPSPDDIAHAEALASWKKIQTNTFIRWANEHLREVGGDPVVDLTVDFSDGVRLITLIESLSRRKFPRRYSRQPVRRNQQLENVTLVLEFLEKEEKIRLVNIDSSDIVDGNIKLILGLMWSLILHYSISRLKWDDETNTDQEKQTELTPKQRLLAWIQNKLPEQNITNFTTDWNDGRMIGALVDSVAPGLCPDWHLWEPETGLENARKAMTIAEEWLSVPQLITPDELTDPKLDEQSAMTYLSRFPSAKPKSSICIRRSGACAVGPGVVGLPLEFFVDSLDEDDISNATVKIIDPAGFTKEFDLISSENTRSLCIQFKPEVEGMHKMAVSLDNAQKLSEGILTFDVKGSVAVSGPGLEWKSVAPLRETYFEVHANDMKIKDLEVRIVQPDSVDKSVLHSDISKMPDGQWRVEFSPLVEGPHLVNVLVNGVAVNGSPYNMFVSSECTEPISMKGRGVQPSGLRVGDDAVVVLQANDTYAEGNHHETLPSENEEVQQPKLDVSSLEVTISDPDGAEIHGISEQQKNRLKYTYRPERVGKFVGAATYRGQSISGSPFVVNVGPAVVCKSRVFGSGLHSGIVGHRACFTVDCHKDENITGIHVNGPQPVEVEVKENIDGSKDVSYIPLTPGEHAVHILFNDNEDIPGSPFMVDVIAAIEDFNPTKVLAYGNGLSENGIPVDEWTGFTVDTTLAGQDAKLCIDIYDDDYNKLEVHRSEGDWVGAVECQYKPQKPGQHKIFISYGGVSVTDKPFRIQVHDKEELPVEATTVEEVSSQTNTLDCNDVSNEEQALHVKAYGDGLGSGFAGHLSNFVVVMSNCGMECLGVAVDGPCKVEMDCIETNEGYKFAYIPRTAGEFIISITYAGKHHIPGSPFHVFIKEATNMYRVRVYTGDKLFAGTDANVSITLCGEIGDTGPVHLKASRTHINKFERNQVDEFFVEAVNIGDLKRIKMGHDNSGVIGTSWFLEHVEIESPLLGKHWVFPFNCWLSKNDLSLEVAATIVDDTRIIPEFSQAFIKDSQEMTVKEFAGSSTHIVSCENTLSTVKHNDEESLESVSNSEDGVGNYHVNVYTGDKLFAGTDANVHIEIVGEKGGTGILELKSSKKNWSKFERNKKNEFVLDVPDVGELLKIRIGHDNSGLFGSSWFLDRVEVESKLLGKMWHFPFHHWLSKEKHGCKPEAELFPCQIVYANKLSGSEKISEKSNVPNDSVKVSGLGLENQLSVYVPTSFLVDVSDADPGNLLLLSVQGPSEPCPVNMTYEGNGIYNVSYKPQEKGEYVISIRWGNQSISGSPFVVTVG